MGIEIEVFEECFKVYNVFFFIDFYDFIIDVMDNFNVKFLINDVCVLV